MRNGGVGYMRTDAMNNQPKAREADDTAEGLLRELRGMLHYHDAEETDLFSWFQLGEHFADGADDPEEQKEMEKLYEILSRIDTFLDRERAAPAPTRITTAARRLEQYLGAATRSGTLTIKGDDASAGALTELLGELQEALAAPAAEEPVGYVNEGDLAAMQRGEVGSVLMSAHGPSGYCNEPLYRHPPAAAPDGYVSRLQAEAVISHVAMVHGLSAPQYEELRSMLALSPARVAKGKQG